MSFHDSLSNTLLTFVTVSSYLLPLKVQRTAITRENFKNNVKNLKDQLDILALPRVLSPFPTFSQEHPRFEQLLKS